jgi:hypothetical protein
MLVPVGAKRVRLVVVALILVAQLVPVDRRNPLAELSNTIYATQNIPPSVMAVLERSCKNCHSNQTNWPWYSYVAPVSWIVAHDVHQARKAMNFSEWKGYSAKRREDKLEEICDQVTNGDMPDGIYLLLHRDALVTQQERQEICQWTEDEREY